MRCVAAPRRSAVRSNKAPPDKGAFKIMTTGTCTRCGKHTQIHPLGLTVEKTGAYTPTGVCQPCETRR